jgi:hypothetical protein
MRSKLNGRGKNDTDWRLIDRNEQTDNISSQNAF